MLKKIIQMAICLIALFCLATPAYAVSETDTAVAYLVEHGIYAGDNNGNLNLEKSLTRAELAVILTRLDFLPYPGEWEEIGAAKYGDTNEVTNTFTDVPAWALPYVEYCYQFRFMLGTNNNIFDPQGAVSPKMASTTILRYCRIAKDDWDYDTSIIKAQSIGIAPVEGMGDAVISRDTMALLIYNGVRYAHTAYTGEMEMLAGQSTPASTPQLEIASAPATTIDEMRMEIIRLTNEARVAAGVSELEVLPELMDCAQAKAQDMVDNDYYDHYSLVYGDSGDMIRSFVPAFVWLSGENISSIAPWSNATQHIMDGWMNSSDHRGNMLIEKYTHIGVGLAKDSKGGYYAVQQFVQL